MYYYFRIAVYKSYRTRRMRDLAIYTLYYIILNTNNLSYYVSCYFLRIRVLSGYIQQLSAISVKRFLLRTTYLREYGRTDAYMWNEYEENFFVRPLNS